MNKNQGLLQRHRTGLWHLRKGGVKGYREWKRRQENTPERCLKKYDANPRLTTINDTSVPVIAGLATMPSRVPQLYDAFHSIYWQVDEVHVFLNNFDDIPEFLKLPKVTIYRSQDFEDYKDVGKFFALTRVSEGILFTVDDDILYPPDYVTKLLSYLASTNYRAVVGVHGFQLPRFPRSFFDRRLLHFRKKLEDVALVSVLGTGTVAFDVSQLAIQLSDFPTYGMADIHLATYLKKKSIPAVVVPRPAGWLKPLRDDHKSDGKLSLYDQTILDSSIQSAALRAVAPWGEEDVLDRWLAMERDDIFSQSFADALGILQVAQEPDAANKLELAHVDLQKTFSWLELYADPTTYSEILRNSYEQGFERNECLRRLWKIDTTGALELSRSLVKERPRDVSVIRQHARFCAGYYLFEEADENYMRASQLAGRHGSKFAAGVLFDYFKFLSRFDEYDKACVLASSLQFTHSSVPLFQAQMVCLHLSRGQVNAARSWLGALLSAEAGSARENAINLVIRKLADASEKTANLSETLFSNSLMPESEISLEDLVSLLKIFTGVRDEIGARHVWKFLSNDFSEYLKTHPELTTYFQSNWSDPSSTGTSRSQEFMLHQKVLSLHASGSIEERGPLVSVLLTAYNAEETLRYAAQSILRQSHKNLELIIVDDASDDNTLLIAQQLVSQDQRVSLIENARNMGPYTSRNIALERAKGDYVAIQDADDVSVPDRIRLQLANFDADTRAVLGQHMRVDRFGRIQLENDGSILGHGPVTLIVRRDVFDEMGPFAAVRTRGDKEFESRLEHFYGSYALKRTSDLLVYALHTNNSDSKVETSSLAKKRNLMLFKESYTRQHAEMHFSNSE